MPEKQPLSIIVHAIPVFDGYLIKNEDDLQEVLAADEELNVELLNDFDIPYVVKKTYSYPAYKRTRKKARKTEDGEGEDEEDEEEDGEGGAPSDEDDDDEDSDEKRDDSDNKDDSDLQDEEEEIKEE